MRNLTIAALAVCAVGANAGGPLNNADGRGLLEPLGMGTEVRPEGGFYSRIGPAGTIFGFGAASPNLALADDFTVGGGGWQLNGATVFGYLTGATTVTATGGTYSIRDNTTTPGTPGAIVTSGSFASAAFTDIYRVTSTGFETNRRVQAITVTFNAVLTPGTYWLDFSHTGVSFVPPLSLAGSLQTPGSNNAMQFNAGAWVPVMDGTTPLDMPFLLEGAAVPEPGTFIAIGLGLAGLALARRRK